MNLFLKNIKSTNEKFPTKKFTVFNVYCIVLISLIFFCALGWPWLSKLKQKIVDSDCNQDVTVRTEEFIQKYVPLRAHSSSPRLACFFHVGLFGTYSERFTHIMQAIQSSGLLDALDVLVIVLVGDINKYPFEIPKHDKIKVKYAGSDISVFERPTITYAQQYAVENPDAYIFYVHNKGASHPLDNQHISSWVDYLIFFSIEKWRQIPKLLDDNVIVCPSFFYAARRIKQSGHCPGNFWWARADYVSLLDIPNPCLIFSDKFEWEFFIGNNLPIESEASNSPMKVCKTWGQTGVFYTMIVARESYQNASVLKCLK